MHNPSTQQGHLSPGGPVNKRTSSVCLGEFCEIGYDCDEITSWSKALLGSSGQKEIVNVSPGSITEAFDFTLSGFTADAARYVRVIGRLRVSPQRGISIVASIVISCVLPSQQAISFCNCSLNSTGISKLSHLVATVSPLISLVRYRIDR